jgi:hypothetical protein
VFSGLSSRRPDKKELKSNCLSHDYSGEYISLGGIYFEIEITLFFVTPSGTNGQRHDIKFALRAAIAGSDVNTK